MFLALQFSGLVLAETSDAEITVEADANGGKQSEEAATVTVIPINESQASGADLGQIIEQAPGVHVVTLGGLGDFSGVGLRGSTLRQTLVYLDGIPLNPDGASVVNLSELPPQAFSHVSVYRGLTPPTIPSASMGGVVVLHSKEERLPTQAMISGGSWNTHRANLYNSSKVMAERVPIQITTFADVFSTNGNFTFFDDNGTPYNMRDDGKRTRVNNDKSQATGQLKIRLGEGQRKISLFNSFLQRDEGISGSIRLPATEARLETQRTMSAMDYKHRFTSLATRMQVWHVHRNEDFDDRASELGLGSQWNRYTTQSGGGLMEIRTTSNSRLVTTTSLTPRIERFQIRDQINLDGSESYLRAGGMFSFGADAFLFADKFQLSPAFILSALQYIEGDDRWYVHPSPRVGVRYSPKDWLTVKGTAGTYFRPPDMHELYGDRGFVLGNPNLRPEQGQQADIGVRINWQRQHFNGSFECISFINPSEDRITYIQNSQMTQIAQNVGSAMVKGIESGLSIQGWNLFSQNTSLTYTESTNKDGNEMVFGNALPGVPKWEIHTQQALHLQEKIHLAHQWHFTSTSNWDAFGWFSNPDRHIHSAFLRIKPMGQGPQVEFGVNNIFNSIATVARRDGPSAQDTGWAVKPVADYNGFPIAGRQLLFTLRHTPASKGTRETQ